MPRTKLYVAAIFSSILWRNCALYLSLLTCFYFRQSITDTAVSSLDKTSQTQQFRHWTKHHRHSSFVIGQNITDTAVSSWDKAAQPQKFRHGTKHNARTTQQFRNGTNYHRDSSFFMGRTNKLALVYSRHCMGSVSDFPDFLVAFATCWFPSKYSRRFVVSFLS
jgi:hypothetical protein